MEHIRWVLFGIGSAGIIYFSWWLSIREGRYHGFARFFAFEGILATILLNAPVWFSNPWSARQIASWVLLFGSIIPALYGYLLLKKLGKPSGNFENTSKLVIAGIYRYIRHPLYASLVWFAWGAYLKDVNTLTSILVGVNTLALFITAKIEEGEMLAKFGGEYREYMRKTSCFIPGIF